ncbi:hypothetical protein TWF694_002493 [Orbilia ellipsospora]|uniref:Uncharacterized protein n=1 Tax=Orbilia ellipsospora TaxID=2528407 RepID=A0AAV9X4N7_9PEZI
MYGGFTFPNESTEFPENMDYLWLMWAIYLWQLVGFGTGYSLTSQGGWNAAFPDDTCKTGHACRTYRWYGDVFLNNSLALFHINLANPLAGGDPQKQIFLYNPNGPKILIDLDMAGSMIAEALSGVYNDTALCMMPGGADLSFWTNLNYFLDNEVPNLSPDNQNWALALKNDGTAANATRVVYCKNRYSIRMYNLRNQYWGPRQNVPVFCKDVLAIAQALFNITQREFKVWKASGFSADVDHILPQPSDPADKWLPIDPATNLPLHLDYDHDPLVGRQPQITRMYADSDWSADRSWGVYLSYEVYGCPDPADASAMVTLMDSTLAW